MDVSDPTELGDGRLRVVERLPVPAGLVGDRLDTVALLGLRDDHRRLAGDLDGTGEGAVDGGDVVAVDLDRLPAERLGAAAVRVEIPAVHRLARLAEPVHVDDRDQVVEAVEAGRLERLPHRPLGHLGVTAQAPDPVGSRSSSFPVSATPTLIGSPWPSEPVATSTHGRTGVGMALDPAAEPTEGEHLLVADGAGGLEHRVQQRRRVALAEDEVVVARVVGRAEVVMQVLRHEDGHQVGGRHRRRRVAAACRAARSNGIDAELLAELAKGVVLTRHVPLVLRKLSAGLGMVHT